MNTLSAPFPGHAVLRVSLWVAQVLLFAVFGLAGLTKLGPEMTGFDPLPLALVRGIGVSELAGAVAVLAGSLTRRPRLSAAAAIGLFVVMTAAAGFHIGRGEFNALPMNVLLAALAAFVAWGRRAR